MTTNPCVPSIGILSALERLRPSVTGVLLLGCLAIPCRAEAQEAPAGAPVLAVDGATPQASPVFKIAPIWLPDESRARASSAFSFPPEWLPDQAEPSGSQSPNRACDGCPQRRPVRAAFGVFGINLTFNLMNRFRPPEERKQFQVDPKSWWANLKYGFEWDDNAFRVNQMGHPYQGGLYFNAARANGMSFWESAPYAAFGSAMWEYFGEKNKPALNDFINTTVGGMAIGEMLHRAGWLIRDPTKTGGARTKSEILAMLLDPITGISRFLSGDASRVSEKPAEYETSQAVGDFEAGVLWRGDNTKAVNATGEPYVQLNAGYGDMLGSPHRQPFDAFTVAFRLGGGSPISQASIRGRLYGRFFGDAASRTHQFMVLQAYDFVTNNVFEFGGQTIATVVSNRYRLSERSDLVTSGGGGVLLLGAFSSPYVFGKDRDYDYGPGLWGVANAVLRVNGRPVAKMGYKLIYMHVVSGTAGDHVAQTFNVDGLVPLRKQWRLGISADFIRRKIYYDYEDDVDNHYPQFRVYLAWVHK